jgi:hypothetical protein
MAWDAMSRKSDKRMISRHQYMRLMGVDQGRGVECKGKGPKDVREETKRDGNGRMRGAKKSYMFALPERSMMAEDTKGPMKEEVLPMTEKLDHQTASMGLARASLKKRKGGHCVQENKD